eukprot:gb/GECG01014918.1/.p1 GENE.gb/GECG01014918.1/~~gb/GECG01014918.1/.p1  ORF type:complete len:265 (+),score=42.08 gb/GECG01014918.1/:1-795(+)
MVCRYSHDIDHPGHSQNYEVNTGSELALRHNDTAVLESHHAHMTSKILQQDDYDIFCNLSREQFKYCRKVILKVILGTDMGVHFTLLQRLANRAAKCSLREGSFRSAAQDLTEKGTSEMVDVNSNSEYPTDPFDIDEEADRLELAEAVVHCADLSGQTGSFNLAKRWGARVFEEFRNEAAMHERSNLTPPSFMKQAQSELDEYKMQPGFITKILLPVWEQLHELLGGLSKPVENLKSNRDAYEEEAKKLESIQELNSRFRQQTT